MIISIAMATFNGEAYIGEQLESFLHQDVLPDELVICDDISSDATLEIVSRFRKIAPFKIEVHKNETRLGHVRNFERAISMCNGDIVFLSDQDDYWFPNKISVVKSTFLNNRGAMVVVNDHEITDGSLQPSGRTKLMNLRSLNKPVTELIGGCTSAHRREWHAVVLPIPDVGFEHDKWINGLAHRLGVAHVIEKPLQYYRRHSRNVSDSGYNFTGTFGRRRRRWITGSRVRQFFYSDPRQTIRRQEAILDRLSSRKDSLDELRLAKASDTLSREIACELSIARARMRARLLPLSRRIPAVLRIWRTGGYDTQAGWKSVVGDVFRPRLSGSTV